MPEEKKNNYAFIDGQNLNSGVNALGWKLDHRKFREYLENNFAVTKAYMFIGFMEEHQDLYSALQESGFILIFKPLIRRGSDTEVKGNVDTDLVLQAMMDLSRYDQAVIVSGDGDFAGLIRHLTNTGKLKQVVIPNKDRYSSLFDRLEDFDSKHVTFMNDLREQLAYKDNRRRRPSRSTDGAKRRSS